MSEYNTSILEAYLKTFGIKLLKEYKFIPNRKYKADYAILEWKLLIEIEGGIYTRQAHGSISGIKRDIEKYNLATIHGWKILRIISDQFNKTQGIDLIAQLRKHNGLITGDFAKYEI